MAFPRTPASPKSSSTTAPASSCQVMRGRLFSGTVASYNSVIKQAQCRQTHSAKMLPPTEPCCSLRQPHRRSSQRKLLIRSAKTALLVPKRPSTRRTVYRKRLTGRPLVRAEAQSWPRALLIRQSHHSIRSPDILFPSQIIITKVLQKATNDKLIP